MPTATEPSESFSVASAFFLASAASDSPTHRDTTVTTVAIPNTTRRMRILLLGCAARHRRQSPSRTLDRSRTSLPLRSLPDAAVVHEADLAPDDLVSIFLVLHGGALQIEVLRIDRLLVQELVELRTQVLHPVVPLRASAVIAKRFDVDHAADVRRAGAIVLPADDTTLVVDDEGAPAERVDGRRLLGEQVVGPHVRGHDVHVVVERAGAALDLEDLVAGGRVRVRCTIHDLGAVQREG